MNTVLKGDTFEQNSYELIKNAIENDEFGISPKYSRVFLKKGYFSNLRQKEIVFDLSIEIWPPNAEKYSLLYLIECKDYSTKKVPVDDIEEFLFKVSQIANLGYFIKGVFISNNSFQEGALEIAKNSRLMLIEVSNNNELLIKLHKINRNQDDRNITEEEKEIEAFLFKVFDLTKVQGLKRYSRKNIEVFSNDLINKINSDVLKYALNTPLDKAINYLQLEYKLNFDFDNIIENEKQVSGYFDVTNNLIKIDKRVYNTERFSFLLAHEIGHFILHRNLKLINKYTTTFKI